MREIINSIRNFKANVNVNEVLRDREDIINTPVELIDITQITEIEGKYIGSTPSDKEGNYILIYRAEDRYILVCNNINLF